MLYGLRGTTLEKVGEIAGVSKGVVLHHFKDKSSLLEAVIRRTNGMLSTSLVELYRHADTPYERLWAVIIANFHESIFNQAVCQAWVSLMAEVPHNRECQRVQIANYARVSSNFAHELKTFLPRTEAKIIARRLNLLIDGIWVRVFSPPADGKLVRGKTSLKVGDKVRVKLVSTDVERGFIDFVTQAD